MGITGNLKTMELAELLQWVSQGNKTGTLVIDDGDVKKRIFFREGRIISSASTDPREHLGHFLVSHGFITEEELSKAVAMQEQSKMLLGKILTTIGAISEEDLHRLLRLKAEESVYDLFSWEEGEFRFVDEELPERTMVPLNLDATSIVLEGVQRLDEWKRIREVIPSAQAIPVAMGDLLDDPKLSPGARKILEQVDDDRTVEEIQIQTHSSEFMVSKVLFDAHRKGKLKVIRPRGAAPSGTSPGVGQGAATAPPDQDVGANELITRAERFLKEGRFEQGLRHLRAARSLEPDAKAVQQALEKGEKLVGDRVSLAGVHPDAVPVLKRTMQELTELQLTAQQGFILT
ncbi:MAG: DUF4388 domain-containing protein, partial [Acidobacteriota bacterium]